MTLEERGLYRDLLDHWYDEGSLPMDEKALRKIAACEPREFIRAWPKVSAKFYERNGRLFNERAEEVMLKLHEQKELLTARGKAGAKAKQKNYLLKQNSSSAQASPNSAPLQLQPQPQPIQAAKAAQFESFSESEKKTATLYEGMLARHRAIYKKFQIKIGNIERAWAKVLQEHPFDILEFAVSVDRSHQLACDTNTWQNGFVEALDKWLLREGWRDEYPEPESDGYRDGREVLKEQEAALAAAAKAN